MTKPGKHRILVVDDELTVCKSIRQVLIREDCEVDMALSGEEALRKEAEKPYDVMIVDLMMPGLSGLDLLKMLKARNPKARIIMVTGYPTMKNTLQAMQLGAMDFLPKPFLPTTLRNLVAAALEAEDDKPAGSDASG
ncbi:MAG: response regulator [Candidatus Aminicenantes bacterium]|nr:response regulator [Candidatus Aminicenantes bacterium]